ncbi:MAG TPA: sugar transferase [Candidatus Krumholzibacteria bacterium]|nr:sugar transferase [Candidatus Krumholzibacteria bacterium]HRX50737.1 sugar transferase [Candidatus Krumholzibacteria bacterium]
MESAKSNAPLHDAGPIGGLYLAEDHPVARNPHRPTEDDILRSADLRYIARSKRITDIVISLGALTVFGLLLPWIALAIKLDSPGPIFFRQSRIGIDRRRFRHADCASDGERRSIVYPGKPFDIVKLRTMRTDAEKDGPQWAKEHDTRITRVGNFLRKTRLDEFPQFVNVLKGEMSVIGPRPERLCFIRQLEHDVPCYMDRLAVLPGITGLAQVVNGYDTDLESVRRKVALDRQYIRSLNWKSDVRIFLMTFRVLFSGDGAH